MTTTLAALAFYYRPIGERVLTGAAYVVVTAHRPPTLVVPPLPGVTQLTAADGSLLAIFTPQGQVPAKFDQISPLLRATLIASEDRTFYTNDGVDPRGIARAALDDLLGRPTQGGSTLTQQYVKNLLINEYGVAYADAFSIERKIREVAYASELTRLLTKRQILTGYLNTVYFGESAYGIGAATRRYFGITPRHLTADQAALLVAIVRSPIAYDPLAHPSAAIAMRNVVLTVMARTGILTPSAAQEDESAPLGLRPTALTEGCLTSQQPTFCEWASSQLSQLPELGPTPAARAARIAAGGLIIRTTLVPADQAAVSSKVSTSSPIGSSMVMIQPGTGAVLAMASNRVYGLDVARNQTTLNYALTTAPVGSTMKIFTLAAVLSAGVPLTTILPAGATYHSTMFANPPGGYFTNADPYDPSYITIPTATAFSVNTAFVQLEEKVGIPAIAAAARAFGLPIPVSGPQAPSPREGSFTLGARAFSPLEMADAYATLADHGRYCAPLAVRTITFDRRVTVPVTPVCHQVIPALVADTITSILAGVVAYGTGTAAAVPGHPLVGKTGTTTGYGSAWFDGYTPQVAAAVWMGNPLGPSHSLLNVDGVPQVYGGTLPAEEFSQAMSVALAGQPVWSIPPITNQYLTLPRLLVPDLSGLSTVDAKSRLVELGLHVQGPSFGTVSATVPAAGAAVMPGSTITMRTGSW